MLRLSRFVLFRFCSMHALHTQAKITQITLDL